jgi:hypothetical protein
MKSARKIKIRVVWKFEGEETRDLRFVAGDFRQGLIAIVETLTTIAKYRPFKDIERFHIFTDNFRGDL